MNNTKIVLCLAATIVSTFLLHNLWGVNYLISLGGTIGLFLTIPLCVQILRKESEQNPLTIFLWSMLDSVAAGSIYLEGGNYIQAVCLSASGLIVVTCILKTDGLKKWIKRWSEFETLVSLLVVFCITVWVSSGNVMAALASISALMIASIPQTLDTIKKPDTTPTIIYIGYTVSNFLATLGGNEISIVEIGYPFSGDRKSTRLNSSH